MDKKILIAGLALAFTLLSGMWLSRAGRPLNTVLLTVHKLVSLAAVVFVVITVNRVHQAAPLNPVETAASLAAALSFVVLLVTGGLLSVPRSMPGVVLNIHRAVPSLAVLSSAAALYLLLVQRQS